MPGPRSFTAAQICSRNSATQRPSGLGPKLWLRLASVARWRTTPTYLTKAIRSGRLLLLPGRRLLRSRLLRLLLAGNWRQHFLLSGRRLARLLAGPLGSFRLGRRAADASAQRFHKIHNVLATGPLLRGDRFAGALLIDEIDQRRFVLIFKLLGLEPSGFLERNDVFALVTTRPMATLVHLADGLADHREGVVPDLAVGS
jgi:hypothetical protein